MDVREVGCEQGSILLITFPGSGVDHSFLLLQIWLETTLTLRDDINYVKQTPILSQRCISLSPQKVNNSVSFHFRCISKRII
jgi:hypothetical protein